MGIFARLRVRGYLVGLRYSVRFWAVFSRFFGSSSLIDILYINYYTATPYFVKNYQKYVINAQKKYFEKVLQNLLTLSLYYDILKEP